MNSADFMAIQDKLEWGASAGGGEVEPYLISIAISLRRIADALDSVIDDDGALRVYTKEY